MSTPIAENLARFRKARNLSQEELAAAASVGVDTVGRIERGERRTTRPATVAKLAQVLLGRQHRAPKVIDHLGGSGFPCVGHGVGAGPARRGANAPARGSSCGVLASGRRRRPRSGRGPGGPVVRPRR